MILEEGKAFGKVKWAKSPQEEKIHKLIIENS